MPTFVADEIVTAAKLNAGTARDWTTWAPSYVGITVGSGTVVARYIQIGSQITCRFTFTMGSGSAMGSGPTVSLPVASISTGYVAVGSPLGKATFGDTGTALFDGAALWASTTTLTPRFDSGAGTLSAVSSTAPFTWTSGDILHFIATYEVA